MSEKTNPQTEFAALTDEELEQVNGGWLKPGDEASASFHRKFCFYCAKRYTMVDCRICMDCHRIRDQIQ